MLAAFPCRPDFRRHLRRLDDTGLAGTRTHDRFYWLAVPAGKAAKGTEITATRAAQTVTLSSADAILVEAGFATNRQDGAFLASADGQRRIATAVADGIVAYLLEFERKLAIGTGGGPAR